MFSPEPAVIGGNQRASTRNPRRRQRLDSDSYRQDQAPRRKRSRLSSDTFLPPTSQGDLHHADTNGHADPGMNGGSKLLQLHGVPVREKQSYKGGRAHKGDDVSVLLKTKNYTVTSFPNVPSPLQGTDYRYSLLPATRHALAVTRSHAYMWDYTTTHGASKPRVLDFPSTIRSTEPLPNGTLLASGSASDVGLLVVTAAGRITFWEDVDAPEDFSLFEQKRYTADGSIGGMLSSEKVSSIVSAEHAGFILVFSTGRLAHLTLHDSQGKPHINTQYLRNQAAGERNGFFGGLKMVFGASSWRGNLAAVKTRRSTARSNMDVIAATTQGEFYVWEVDWSGQQEYKGAISAGTVIETALSMGGSTGTRTDKSIRVVDFVLRNDITQNSQDPSNTGMMRGLNIVALVEESGMAGVSTYTIVELSLASSAARVGRLISCEFPMKTHDQTDPQVGPKLCLPQPGHTAIITFSFAIVLVSIKAQKVTPESQLLTEARAQYSQYQDIIHVIKNEKARIMGCCEEPTTGKNQEAELAIFARDAGLLRLSIPEDGPGQPLDKASNSLKSKIEQAVFYGGVRGTLIDFNEIFEADFTSEQIRRATMNVSRGIVKSRLELLQTKPSMLEQLHERGRLLRNLALYLRKVFPSLPRNLKWILLWDAEKIECARVVWSLFEARYAEKGPGYRTNLEKAVACVDNVGGVALDLKRGETDELRSWFTRDSDHFEYIIRCALEAIRQGHYRKDADILSDLGMTLEANKLATSTLNTAYQFRFASLRDYGLEHDTIKLDADPAHFSGIPEIWTSREDVMYPIREMVRHSFQVLDDLDKVLENSSATDEMASAAVLSEAAAVAGSIPELIRVIRTASREHVRWLDAQEAQGAQDDGGPRGVARDALQSSVVWQMEQISRLPQVELWDDAIKLAEEMGDMGFLVEIITNESDEHAHTLTMSSKEREKLTDPVGELRNHNNRMRVLVEYIARYFQEFGWKWANPYYHSVMRRGTLSGFLSEARANEEFATRFLRENIRSYGKLGWINEVTRKGENKTAGTTGTKDFSCAGDMLTNWVRLTEKNVWSAKVEANMAKLAYMAEWNMNPGSAMYSNQSAVEDPQLQQVPSKFQIADSESKLLDIQERIFAHVAPLLEKALDMTAKMQLVVEEFASRVIKFDRKGHARMLHKCLEKLVRLERLLPDELVELLTLMDQRKCEDEESDISGQECGLALEVLKLMGLQDDEELERAWSKLIWKRALVRDDWKTVNATKGKSDAEINQELRMTETYGAFKSLRRLEHSSTLQLDCAEDCIGADVDPEKTEYDLIEKDLVEILLKDNAADDEVLNNSLEHHRLGYWFDRSKALEAKSADTGGASEENGGSHEDIEEGLRLLKESDEDFFNDRKKVNGHARTNGEDGEINGAEEDYEDEMDQETEEDMVTDIPFNGHPTNRKGAPVGQLDNATIDSTGDYADEDGESRYADGEDNADDGEGYEEDTRYSEAMDVDVEG
ncbi:hypothetical protein EV356DRAFT_579388 [Viridothelium virens]|uniref:Uncharacterized protein n=1 Tax=Viridothelium virens TaxID=1048519 RepID=A0A6A6GZT2_VIRVR|nr:hypothetical protein EV356DRAFT_579388 [Viridothelium virens]